MIIGYNTNGFSEHELADAVEFLARLGYKSIALTLQRDQLDPPDSRGVSRAVEVIQPLISAFGLRVTIETGARFILDKDRKHHPSLVSRNERDRRKRIDFLKAAVDVAAELSAESVSLWSGTPDTTAGDDEFFEILALGLSEVLAHASDRNVRISFEPEPDMLIDTMQRFENLFTRLKHPLFGLTLDVGHLHCLDDGDLGNHLRRWKDVLWNVHIEDMRRGVHEHLMFGDGEMDFGAVVNALREVNYQGPIHVELSRHSQEAERIARESYAFLRDLIP